MNNTTKKRNTAKATPRYGRRCLGKGVYVVNDTRLTHLNNNDVVIAGPGGGKTGGIVYAQLKSLSDSSLIVSDTKNMLHRMFRDELEKKGYKVRVLDFVNPAQSCMYNPLDYVRQNADGSVNEMDIMKIASAMIPDTLDGKEPFWATSARAVLEFFLAYTLCALPAVDHTMYTVSRLCRAYSQEMGEAAFIDWIEAHPGSFAANRWAQMKSMKVADRMFASFIGFVNVALYPFDVADLRHIFDPSLHASGESLRIEELGREKTVLFLNISDTSRSLDSLVNLFYTQALQTLVSEADKRETGQLEVPCRIIFDDFASGTVIPDFDKVLSVIRSRDIWVTLCIQSLSQLQSLYGNARSKTILNNCDHIIYLGSNDLDSAEYIGTRAGRVPDEILRMDRSKEYFIEGGKKAVLLDKIPPYSYSEPELQAE